MNPIIVLQMLTHTDTMDGMYINNNFIIMNSSLSYKINQIHPLATFSIITIMIGTPILILC